MKTLLQSRNDAVDGAGLAVFRILFGALMVFSTIRFGVRGWISELYLVPTFHFTYLGFDWVKPWPAWGMYLHFTLMGIAALCFTIGLFTRLSIAVFFVLFTYVELIDKTPYLNHYYFVSLVSFLAIFLPTHAVWSVDATIHWPKQVPRWSYWILRGQLVIVYFFAGFAKLNPDWLFRGEPLYTWLQTYAHIPWIGSILGQRSTALFMSWCGAFFDLFVPWCFLNRRMRRTAYVVALGFHFTVWLLLPIGVFSWVMLISTTIFFDPSWPRKILRKIETHPVVEIASNRLPRWAEGCVIFYFLIQIAIPLRFVLYPGSVNWTEEAFRFSWRVMLIEKTGQVEFSVVSSSLKQPIHVFPRQDLTPLQYKMMSTQPDMIHQYARFLREKYRTQGLENVKVYADAWASLNGRPSQRLIHPTVDLGAIPFGLLPQSWIVPLK